MRKTSPLKIHAGFQIIPSILKGPKSGLLRPAGSHRPRPSGRPAAHGPTPRKVSRDGADMLQGRMLRRGAAAAWGIGACRLKKVSPDSEFSLGQAVQAGMAARLVTAAHSGERGRPRRLPIKFLQWAGWAEPSRLRLASGRQRASSGRLSWVNRGRGRPGARTFTYQWFG
jgi:hypothetical protein